MLSAPGYVLTFSLLWAFSFLVIAEEPIKNRLTCFAKHLDTNAIVEVETISSIATSKIATAQWPLGYPTIAIDDSAYAKLPGNVRQFIYYHECAHLQSGNVDEKTMDCVSIDFLIEKHNYTTLDIRKLIQTLSVEFGWRRRWRELLNCPALKDTR
jgi:hypothetical protein